MNMEEYNLMEEMMPLSVGNKVPPVSFKAYHNEKIIDMSTESLKGKWYVLFFYPGDFTFVCPTELSELADKYDEFQEEGIEIISMSTDTAFSHKIWHETSDAIKKVKYPMGSDHRHIFVDLFNAYCEEDGLAYRATILVDDTGVIRATEVNDNSIGRNADELLRKAKAAKFVSKNPGQVCPASWDKGKDTLKPGDDLVGKI